MPAAFKAGNGCFRRINKHGRDFVVRTQPVNRAKCRLENRSCKVSVGSMNTAMANDEAGIQAQPREMTRRQLLEWFTWMDHILDVHRSRYVFRQPSPKELEDHKSALKQSIRYSLLFNTLIADPEFNDPDLVARLQVRIRQLQDAYDTFHDATLSDVEAGKILKQVFPE